MRRLQVKEKGASFRHVLRTETQNYKSADRRGGRSSASSYREILAVAVGNLRRASRGENMVRGEFLVLFSGEKSEGGVAAEGTTAKCAVGSPSEALKGRPGKISSRIAHGRGAAKGAGVKSEVAGLCALGQNRE